MKLNYQFEIYYTYIRDCVAATLLSYSNLLPSGERERMSKFKRSEDAYLFLLGRLLILKNILGEDMGKLYLMRKNNFGKPYFDNYPFFNLSHSGEIVILIKSSIAKVGIDIEKNVTINIHDFKSIFTVGEYSIIKSSQDPVDTFYNYWTQKEAIVKCVGKGLNLPLSSFEVNDNLAVLNDREVLTTKKLVIDDAYTCHFSYNSEYSNAAVKIERQFII